MRIGSETLLSRFRSSRALGAAVVLAAGLSSITAFAADDDHAGHDHAGHDHAGHDHAADDSEHEGDHGDHHGGGEVNWYYGMFGTSDEIDHSNWMQRTPGTPVPILAQLFNTLILFSVLYKFGKQPIVDGLRNRRESILKGMAEAGKMKADAEAQLDEYERKLQQVDDEIARVRKQMSEMAAAEREQILAEAKKRRERMERDATLLIQQELKAARQQLLAAAINGAVHSAERLVSEKITADDHTRLGDEYLAGLRESLAKSGLSSGGLGSGGLGSGGLGSSSAGGAQ